MNAISSQNKSYILKIALFATGLSGIVAEYVLSALASYFLGDAVIQWTMTVSVMLFSMGLGSRLSKYMHTNLLERLIFIECILSVLASLSAVLVYTVAAFTVYTGVFIYVLCILIGLLIGLEIPLVTRINDEYEDLRTNIATVMEKDYYGSLAGGAFFAFVGLPFLGLTYTPFVLGSINFAVAIWLYIKLRSFTAPKARPFIQIAGFLTLFLIIGGWFAAAPIVLYGEQAKYKDKVVYEEQSQYQKIVVSRWQNDYWLYLDGHQQLSSLDEFLYHEPMVHSAAGLIPGGPRKVLVLGGGDGCAVRELLKYAQIEEITLVDLDPAMTRIAREHPIFIWMNKNSLNDKKVRIFNRDGFNFLQENQDYYDLILIDLPDPKNVDLNKLYTKEFYALCGKHLREKGILITQAGSPYYAAKAFVCVELSIQAGGFRTLPLHNQVITMGEWGWVIGSKSMDSAEMKDRLQSLDLEKIPTRWLNTEAMKLVTSFGKDFYGVTDVKVNTIAEPVLFRYYRKGNWDLY